MEVRKEFHQRRPVSWYRLTHRGRATLQAHVSGLRDLLRQAHAGAGGVLEPPPEAPEES